MKQKRKKIFQQRKANDNNTINPAISARPLNKAFLFLSYMFIAALGLAIYSNTFRSSFHFDDNLFITNNLTTRNIRDLSAIWAYLPCRFVLYLSFALNYHFSHFHVVAYHLFNIAVHLTSAVLVAWLMLLTLATPVMKGNGISRHAGLIALLSGLVFVSHPLQTEAVTYIMQRAASLAALFYLASLCLYIKARSLQEDQSAGARFCYVASWIAAILAMFTKENTITLPLMVLLYEICFFRTDRGLKLRYLMGFLPAVLIIPLTMFLTKSGHAVSTHEMKIALEGATPITPAQYLFTEFRVMVTYIRLLFLPVHQNVDYDYPIFKSFFEGPVVFSFLFLTAVLGTAVRLFPKYRLMAFSVFWFFLTLLPESSIFPIQDVIFEHRLYLPMAGFSMFLAGGLYYLLGRKSIKIMVIVLLMVITVNSVLTYQRNKIWRDDITFWSDALRKSPHKARPYNNLGKVYLDQGHAAKALPYFNKAIELNPYDGQAYYNRGYIFNSEGHYGRAVADFSRAIAINPNSWEAYNQRGITYINQGHFDEAMADLNKSIGLHPDAKSYYNRGIVFDRQGHLNQAIADFDKAIAIKADYPEAYINRGRDYSHQQDFNRAILDFKQAIKLKADYPLAYNNLGLIYQYKGDYSQAILDFDRAIALKRDYADAYKDRGLAYMAQKQYDLAVADFNKAIAFKANDAEIYNNRGFANEDKGHYNQAISDYNKAIELDPKDPEAYANRGRAYGRKKNFSQAIEDFNKAIGLAPKFTQAHINRSVAFYFMKDYGQAWRDVHQAEALGGHLDPKFIAGLKSASGRDH